MKLTPQLDAILSELTNLCCDALQAGKSMNKERVDSLVQNLSVNGWERHSENLPPLSEILKGRIKDNDTDTAMHRGAEVDGIVGKIQSTYNETSRMQASTASDQKLGTAMPPRTTA